MSNEEFERKMEFIVEQQAQFASDMHQLRVAQAQTDQVVAQTGEIVARLANVTFEAFKGECENRRTSGFSHQIK